MASFFLTHICTLCDIVINKTNVTFHSLSQRECCFLCILAFEMLDKNICDPADGHTKFKSFIGFTARSINCWCKSDSDYTVASVDRVSN